MYCANCGERLNGDEMFCANCGSAAEKKVEANEQSSDQPSSEGEVEADKADAEADKADAEADKADAEADKADAEADKADAEAGKAEIESESDMTPVKKETGKKKLPIIIASCAVAVVVIAVAVVLLVMHLNRTSAYDEAVELMDRGNYNAAHEMFVDLGSFRDSEELALETRLRADYYAAVQLMDRSNYLEAREAFLALGSFRDSAELAVESQQIYDYNHAMGLLDNESFSEAKVAFEALGDFRDSADMAAHAQLEIDYLTALEYMDAGDYAIARDMFDALGFFRDSFNLVTENDNRILYGEAVALIGGGNHAGAIELLEYLAEIDFRDSADLLLESNNVITFGLAVEAYDAELFYTAHNLFTSLGDFQDSRSRAAQSIQELPETGQIYRNEDFAGRAVELRITSPSDDPRPTFLKIYTDEEVLVSTVFLRSGASHTVRLPVGTYMIRMGFGDNWFGFYEYFGDANAIYMTMILDDEGNTTHRFRSNFIYTLTLRPESDLFDIFSGLLNEGRDGF